jgi:hypothetical protein
MYAETTRSLNHKTAHSTAGELTDITVGRGEWHPGSGGVFGDMLLTYVISDGTATNSAEPAESLRQSF